MEVGDTTIMQESAGSQVSGEGQSNQTDGVLCTFVTLLFPPGSGCGSEGEKNSNELL